ncbi:50S ribosomal protein L22 [Candidatus Kaiserbacteria bacterium]|nr:50S ribosomal protein L22 [Candidatus Kaiserbacteria bacterium]
MKALLKNYHQAPRKVRLVADLIRGKSVPHARAALAFLPKKAAPTMGKLLDSAVANAANRGYETHDLYIKTITVDKGVVMRRFRPFGRGRSGAINKEMSIVKIELASKSGTKAPEVGIAAKAEKPGKPAVKKTVAKKTAAKKTTSKLKTKN